MTFDLFVDISETAHGIFNSLLALAFLYQAWMGLTIRGGRKKGAPRFVAIKRHRRFGPFLVALGILGYCFGLILVYIDKGRVLEYPLHLAVGSLIVIFLLGQYAVSRKIKGLGSPWRTPHLAVGVGILCLYALQIVIGLTVFF